MKNALTFTGSKAEEIYLVNGDSAYVPFDFDTGSSVVCKDASNKDAQVRIKLDKDLKNTDNPYKFATGDAITPAWANKFTCTNTDHVVYYQDGDLYIAHKDNTAYTGLRSSITGSLDSNKFSVTNPNTDYTYGGQISNITISTATGWKFADNASITTLQTQLAKYGLSASYDGTEAGTITISGKLYGNLDLSKLTFPTPVEDTYTVALGNLPAGLNPSGVYATSALVTAGGTYTATFEVDEDHILDTDYLAKLNDTNNGLLKDTGLTASITANGELQITGTINKDVDLSSKTWPAMTETEAMVGNNKHPSLANAINETDEGTVEMKKNPATEVTNATLNSGVTLKDTTGNTYKATGGDATVSVGTDGKVTLTTGKLEVTPSDTLSAGETADVTVKTGSDATTTVSGSDPFTVTAANGDTKATVTIPTANKSVTTGTGLTFTAGSANATFPLDGSKLNNNGDAVTVGAGKTAEVEVGAVPGESESATPIKVKVPGTGKADTTDAVTVTKGDGTNTMATVTVKKAGDSFTVGGKTYVAGANDTEFTIDKDGSVKLTSGGLSLGDGESTTGAVSGKTILNPTSSGGDTITVEKKTDYDEVTVPKQDTDAGSVKIGDKTYTNNSTTEDLKLKVTSDGVSVISGSLTESINDGESLTGTTSGATIANPGDSGDDTITVTSDSTKDTVTVPAGTDKSVTITKAGETTGETYFNGAQANASLVIDVTAAGASLYTGNVALRENQGIGVYGNTITYTNSNDSEEPLTVRIYEYEGDISNALIDLKEGRSFTDKDGNTYTAKNGKAEFAVDKNTGEIRLASGSAEVTPAANKHADIKVAKTASAANDADFYTVSGSEKFTVTAGSGGATATVTLPAGKSATSGSLTFTAGANVGDNGSTFPLDGSALNNNGDKLTVAAGGSAEVKVGTDTTIKVPTTNSGATTITKGTPTIVKIGKDGDKFKVNDAECPTIGSTKAGEEYAINTDGTVTKIEAKVFDANGTMVGHGSLMSMLNNTPVTAKTIEMVIAPETVITNATLNNGVTLKDLNGNQYKANGEGTKINVDTTGKVSLTEGKLDVTPAATKTASVEVAKNASASAPDGFYSVSGSDKFTVTAGKGSGTEGNDKATVTIAGKDKTVTVAENADKGLTFTAGQDGSTFPLDGSKLNNTGDSVTVGKDFNASHDVQLSDNVTVTVPDNSGATTVTKGQPAGFDGKVTLDKSGDKFTVGGTDYTAAANDTTFAVKKDGDTTTAALVSGAVKVPAGGSTDVRPDGWSKSVSVSVPTGGDEVTVSTVSGNPAKGKAEVKSGKSVTIGGKTYTAAADDTAFTFDENGNVTLASGKVELDKTESILGGVSGVEIKNTSAESITDPVTVEKGSGKDIVTVPAGGKVTIGGKEYTNSGSGEMKLEIDADGNVTLADGEADFGKDTSLNLNGAEIKNTGNSALTMTENGSSDTLNVAEGGSFTVGTGTVKDPSADMSFTINDDGTLTATLPENGSVTINGVKYTGGAGGAELTLDKDGNLSISGTYTANIPGQTAHEVSGKVVQDGSGVPNATVTLTQGGKETVKLATVTTGSDGSYKFPAVPAGTYNVVVTKTEGGVTKTLTQLVTVSNGNVTVGDLVLPSANVSSVVDVKPSSPVGAMVGGLDTVASNNEVSGKTVKITLSVDTAVENNDIAALPAAAGKTLVYLDMSLVKTVNGSPEPFSNSQVLEIILTFDTTNKTNITVYRNHGGTAAALTKLDTRPTSAPYTDGTYYVGNGFVVVYTSKFSPYAIGYDVVSYSGGSGGSGSSASTSINVGKTTNGSVSVSPKSTGKGNTVTITVKPDAGFKLGSLTVTDKNGNALTVKKLSDTQYTFIAPAGKVDVKAVFVKAGVGYADCAKDSTCPVAAFTDTLPSAWYHDGVHYCVDNGLMSGYSNGTFAPDRATTRAQLVVMLWRLNGCPVVDSAVDFTDVPADAWCAEAIRWAKATGVSGGYGDGTFGPDNTMTREQMVTFLYRYAQNMNYDVSVGESTNILSFADAFSVSEYAIPAMQWACGSGMMAGKRDTNGDMILMPQGTTTRAQMATMLMRFCAEIVK